MLLEWLLAVAGLLAIGIETAYVPTDNGGGEYLVRVEPDLVKSATPYTLTSDVPADAQNVRRVKIYIADAWPPAVERSVNEAAKRPRVAPVAIATARAGESESAALQPSRPWGLLTGSLVMLFLSLGANGYLGMLLATMRSRYLRDIQQGIVRA